MRDKRRRQLAGMPDGSDTDSTPERIQVLCGPQLCVLHVWSEAEWAGLPEPERPANSEHVVGLGWVGAVPTECMN
jgi:hypothetical protein